MKQSASKLKDRHFFVSECYRNYVDKNWISKFIYSCCLFVSLFWSKLSFFWTETLVFCWQKLESRTDIMSSALKWTCNQCKIKSTYRWKITANSQHHKIGCTRRDVNPLLLANIQWGHKLNWSHILNLCRTTCLTCTIPRDSFDRHSCHTFIPCTSLLK